MYATASPGKWPVVVGNGVDPGRVASSRDVAFEDRIRAATGGRGVDVVLNSLAGPFVDASLRLLAPGGRFIEMGKTDVRSGLDVAYHAFDLAEAGPARMGQILAEVVALFEQGVLEPLPITVWDVRDAVSAWRFMAQAKHVGKNVLSVPARLDPERHGVDHRRHRHPGWLAGTASGGRARNQASGVVEPPRSGRTRCRRPAGAGRGRADRGL